MNRKDTERLDVGNLCGTSESSETSPSIDNRAGGEEEGKLPCSTTNSKIPNCLHSQYIGFDLGIFVPPNSSWQLFEGIDIVVMGTTKNISSF